MRYVTLEAVTDEYDNKPGFKIKGTPSFDGFMADRTGEMIAHDIVEHQNGLDPMGAVWDELEALGGIWHCRGRWGDIGRESIHSAETNVASDITRMFVEWDGYNGPHSMRTQAHDYDESFREIIAIARHDIPREYDNYGDGTGEHLANLDAYLDLALHRMRTGYRKAQRRFDERFGSNNQYRAIKEAVEKACRHIDYEGQQFRLAYGAGEATVNEIYESDDY
jgi:hypothetical protein